ncbi:MAG TPA: hypothetical protein VE568_07320 [Rubrobacter sp.]|nr:hypothetical protein [Rubrobacter sp.]
MRKTIMLFGAVMAALVAMGPPTPERGFSPQPAEAARPALSVIVACQATPERTRVQNNRRRAVTIKSVGSIYQPFSYEPIMVNRKLAARKAITFESGRGANQTTLTGAYIYNNDVGSKEGARVVTKSGLRFTDRCS